MYGYGYNSCCQPYCCGHNNDGFGSWWGILIIIFIIFFLFGGFGNNGRCCNFN